MARTACKRQKGLGLTREVFVYLLHFQDDIIWDTSFSQQHIELTRHTASYRVNTKPVGAKFNECFNTVHPLLTWLLTTVSYKLAFLNQRERHEKGERGSK